MTSSAFAPTPQRIAEIDLLRGFAVLGIFVMNLMGFALPLDAYGNPAVAGGDAGWDRVAFYLQDALFDGRMRAIFCLLFGASLAISLDRARAPGGSIISLHRRNFWLVVIGLLHCVLLQMPGDILFDYGVVALVIWSFAGARASRLLAAGIVMVALVAAFNLSNSLSSERTLRDMTELQQLVSAGETLAENDRERLAEWLEQPERAGLAGAREKARQRIQDIREARSWTATWVLWTDDMAESLNVTQSVEYLAAIAGVMFLGMALYRLGFLAGRAATQTYVIMLAIGLAASLCSHLLTRVWAATGWVEGVYPLDHWYYVGYEPLRILSALGWVSAIILSVRLLGFLGIHRALAATGRAALSVYLSQTIIATTLFYGWGFGLYGAFSRGQLMLIALVILASLVIAANLWLARNPQGPVESVWRRLSQAATASA